eukprot:SM000011S18957  [mRNA]  locus=s11:34806:37816:- [translate_table: standard]
MGVPRLSPVVPVPPAVRDACSRLLAAAQASVPELRLTASCAPRDGGNKAKELCGGRQLAAGCAGVAEDYHVSLSRTAPIRFAQIESLVAMLRDKLRRQQRYSLAFGRWEPFINDEQTTSFLAFEATGEGVQQIRRQVAAVDHCYKLHGLPGFYEEPRPHISLAWAAGDLVDRLADLASKLNAQGVQGDINRGSLADPPLRWTSDVTQLPGISLKTSFWAQARGPERDSSKVLGANHIQRGEALAGLEVEDEHRHHRQAGVLDLSLLQPSELCRVRDVLAPPKLASQAEGVEEPAARVALLTGRVNKVLGSAEGVAPLNSLRAGVEEVDATLRLHPSCQEKLGAEESAEGEGSQGAGLGTSLKPLHTREGLTDEDSDHCNKQREHVLPQCWCCKNSGLAILTASDADFH